MNLKIIDYISAMVFDNIFCEKIFNCDVNINLFKEKEYKTFKLCFNVCKTFYNEFNKPISNKFISFYERKKKSLNHSSKDEEIDSFLFEQIKEASAEIDGEVYFSEFKNFYKTVFGEVFNKADSIEKDELLKNYNDLSGKIVKNYDFTDSKSLILKELNDNRKSITNFPGAAGKFLNNFFLPGELLFFMGPMKSGKTYWLIECAKQALSNRKKVLYISIGDMTAGQVQTRLFANIGGYSYNKRLSREIIYKPVFDCKKNQDKSCPYTKKDSCGICVEGETIPTLQELYEGNPTEYTPCTECRNSQNKGAYQLAIYSQPHIALGGSKRNHFLNEERLKIIDEFLASIDALNNFKLQFHTNEEQYTPTDLKNQIKTFVNNNWYPDMVVIDYADLLVPKKKGKASVDDVMSVWGTLRDINTEFPNLMIVTASQCNAEGLRSELLKVEHYSGSKFKIAQATTVIGINRNEQEKLWQLCRLNIVVGRESPISDNCQLLVTQNLGVAQPICDSMIKPLQKKQLKKSY